MFSWSCFEHEEFNLFVSISDQSLAQGHSQLEPFGLAGLGTLQGIADTWLVSVSLGQCSRFLYNQNHRPDCKVNVSLLSRCVEFAWLCAERFLTCLTFFLPTIPRSCSNLFLVSLPWTHAWPFVGFVLSNSNLVTSMFPPIFIVFKNLKFRYWSNVIPIYVIFHNTSETLSNFNIGIWDPGLLLFLLKERVEILAWGRHSLCTQRGITAVLWISPVLHGNTNSQSPFKMSASFDLKLFMLVSDRSPVQLSLLPTSTRAKRIHWKFQEVLLCRTDALDLSFLLILDEIALLLQME